MLKRDTWIRVRVRAHMKTLKNENEISSSALPSKVGEAWKEGRASERHRSRAQTDVGVDHVEDFAVRPPSFFLVMPLRDGFLSKLFLLNYQRAWNLKKVPFSDRTFLICRPSLRIFSSRLSPIRQCYHLSPPLHAL